MNGSKTSAALGLFSIAAMTFMSTPVSAQSTASAADKAFLMKASQANIAEIAAGKLAQQKSSSNDVRMLGKRFADNHTSNQKQLTMVAKNLGVMLPMSPAPADKMAMMKLQGMSGAAFDTAYVSMEEKDHMKNIAAFKQQAGMPNNMMVAAYVKASLPVLEEHLQIATDDATKMHRMGAMGSSMGTSHMSGSGSTSSGSMGAGNSMGAGGSAGSGGSMGSGGTSSGSTNDAGAASFGKTSTGGGVPGTAASKGAGGSLPQDQPSPATTTAPSNMNSSGNSAAGTPGAKGAGGSNNPNSGPNTNGAGSSGTAPRASGSAPPSGG